MGRKEQVWEKVKEEIAEFQVEIAHMDKDKAEAEFGDVMFSLINAARLYKINPDNALERTNQNSSADSTIWKNTPLRKAKPERDVSRRNGCNLG